jgi:hypothetical protein
MERLPKRNPERNTKAVAGFIKRKNRISGQFSAKLIEMLESPAWRVLSLSARRLIDRLEIELGHHGGNDNGQLPVTKEDFIDYGISGNQIAPAIREAQALGFIHVTEQGRAGNSEYRFPSKYFLTFAHARASHAQPPTHDWRKIKTLEEAEAIAAAARSAKNPAAVMAGRRSWALRKNRNRYQKPIPAPVSETNTEMPKPPVLETNTTGWGRKPILLSISSVGKAATVYAGSNPSPRYPMAKPTQPYAGYGSLPVELRMLALGLPVAV